MIKTVSILTMSFITSLRVERNQLFRLSSSCTLLLNLRAVIVLMVNALRAGMMGSSIPSSVTDCSGGAASLECIRTPCDDYT